VFDPSWIFFTFLWFISFRVVSDCSPCCCVYFALITLLIALMVVKLCYVGNTGYYLKAQVVVISRINSHHRFSVKVITNQTLSQLRSLARALIGLCMRLCGQNLVPCLFRLSAIVFIQSSIRRNRDQSNSYQSIQSILIYNRPSPIKLETSNSSGRITIQAACESRKQVIQSLSFVSSI